MNRHGVAVMKVRVVDPEFLFASRMACYEDQEVMGAGRYRDHHTKHRECAEK